MPFTEFPIPSAELSTVAADARTAIDAMQNTNAAVNAAIADDAGATREALGLHVIHVTDPEYAGGAKFDGVTDDTAAINAALLAAAQATGPCEVVFPPGTAKVGTGDVSITIYGRDGLRVRGAGPWVTQLKSVSNTAPVIQYRKPTIPLPQPNYVEWMELADFAIFGTGVQNSTTYGLHLHDNTIADDFFNGGSLRLRNLRIGADGAGFRTGYFLKRWDTFIIENVRVLYCYNNAYLEKFTKTGTILGGGNSQSEGPLWILGPGARVNFIGVDNGNSPQWIVAQESSTATIMQGSNFESQRYSTTATRRFNFATTTYPQVANVSSVDVTGLFTTAANNGFKPGMRVAFGCQGAATTPFVPHPAPLIFGEMYEIAESGITATTFRLLPVPRFGSVAVGSSSITVIGSSQRANYDDLVAGDKVRLTTEGIANVVIAYTGGESGGGARLPDAEYFIVGKTGANIITVSEVQGGTPIVFQTAASVRINPVSPIIPTAALGTNTTVFAPSIALTHSAVLTIADCQFTSFAHAPHAALGTGSVFNSVGTWHTSDYPSTGLTGAASTIAPFLAGRVLAIGNNCLVDGFDIPVTTRTTPNDSTMITYNTMRKMVNNSDSGYNATAARRTAFHWMLGKDGSTGLNDRALAFVRDARGLFGPEPFLNRDIVRTIAVTSGTFSIYSELKPRQKYRIDHSAASATLEMVLPDNSTTGTYTADGLHTDERVAVDDEIEIFVVNANGQTVNVKHGTATGTVRVNSSTVTTAGTTHGISLVGGDYVRLKCTSISGTNVNWQVVQSVGTIGTF